MKGLYIDLRQIWKNSIRYLFAAMLEVRLGESAYIAGDDFTVADIAAVIAFDLAKVLRIRVTDETPNLQRWYDAVAARWPECGGSSAEIGRQFKVEQIIRHVRLGSRREDRYFVLRLLSEIS